MRKRILSAILALSMLMPLAALQTYAEEASATVEATTETKETPIPATGSGIGGGSSMPNTGAVSGSTSSGNSGGDSSTGGYGGNYGSGSTQTTPVPAPTTGVVEGTDEGIIWNIEGETLIISGNGAMPDYSYSESAPWNSEKYSVKHIVIEDGVTSVGQFAFRYFEQVETVTLGSGIETIGQLAFSNCSKLTEINFPEGLKKIGSNAFYFCTSLASVELPESLERIEDGAFRVCWNLADVTIGSNLKYVGSYVFEGDAILDRQENWQDGLFYLGTYVIDYDEEKAIDYVTIREGTTYISDLNLCRNMKVVYVPESVTAFDYYTFPETTIIEGEAGSAIDIYANANNKPFFVKGEKHIKNGTCEDGFRWELDFDTRTLTLKGEGEMMEYNDYYERAPWHKYYNFISEFIVGEGITKLTKYAIEYYAPQLNVYIPESVTQIDVDGDLSNVTVHGKAGSYAETFAIENGLLFVDEDGNIFASGVCGDDAEWKYNAKTGKLIISGTGAISDYSLNSYEDNTSPWASFDVEEIEIKDGITKIGKGLITTNDMEWVWVLVPNSVIAIEESAFSGNITVYCEKDSFAHSHCEQNEIPVEAYGEYEVLTVETEEEFLNAIGSNRTIILMPGLYTFDETIKLTNRRDLLIKAENTGEAELLTRDGYKPAMTFNHCSNAEVKNLIIGHTSVSYGESGCGGNSTSSGYVIYGHYSKDIRTNKCDLYGCGTVAVYLYESQSFLATDCVLRDCKENAVTARYYKDSLESNAVFTNCIVSGNAYDGTFAATRANVITYGADITFNDCLFMNNFNTVREDEQSENAIEFFGCRFEDNAWDNLTPKNKGICLNGITWELLEEETDWGGTQLSLKLGYPLEYESGNIESEKGRVLSYSQYSKPWIRNLGYNYIENYYLADGVSLGGYLNSKIQWEIKDGSLIISGEGDMPDMSPWADYQKLIKKIVVEDGITGIKYGNFYRCSQASTIELGKDVATIEKNPFRMSILSEIKVSEENPDFASVDGVLYSKDLTRLIAVPKLKAKGTYTVSDTVKIIGTEAFYGSREMTGLILSKEVMELEDGFISSTGVISINIPSGVTRITENALDNPYLEEITVDAGNKNYSADGGVLFNKDKTMLIKYPVAKPDISYSVPYGVKEIGNSAFRGVSKLLIVTLPDTVTKIGDSGLYGYGIKKAVIPASVTEIGEWALPVGEVSVTVVCEENSFVHQYAMNNGIKYTFIDNVVVATSKEVYDEETDEQKVIVSVSLPTERTVDGYVLVGLYDRNGVLVSVKKAAVTGSDMEIEFIISSRDVDYINWRTAKVLWWDLDGKANKPLGTAAELRR